MVTSNFDLFAGRGLTAKTKLLHLGPADSGLLASVRSLNLEHVSPAGMLRSEISRHRNPNRAVDGTMPAALRRWFFARKPDAGFVLTDFPATLLQALVFDEWLDARDESLDGVMPHPSASGPVVEHYRTLGLLHAAPETVSA